MQIACSAVEMLLGEDIQQLFFFEARLFPHMQNTVEVFEQTLWDVHQRDKCLTGELDVEGLIKRSPFSPLGQAILYSPYSVPIKNYRE